MDGHANGWMDGWMDGRRTVCMHTLSVKPEQFHYADEKLIEKLSGFEITQPGIS